MKTIKLQGSLLLLLFLLLLYPTPALRAKEIATYQLSLAFDLEQATLVATARISLPPHTPLHLQLRGLEVTGTLLRHADGREQLLGDLTTSLPRLPDPSEIFISYRKRLVNDPDNHISPQGITLVRDWYPQPLQKMIYELSASLPEGFEALSPSDQFPLSRQDNTVSARFAAPLDATYFVAGPYQHASRKLRDGLSLHTLFFQQEAHLAQAYLDSASTWLKLFEQDLGPYPFPHFVIVANLLPSGYSIPTSTLLGRQILPLPFIREISLGHELVHSWFGNSVIPDWQSGNWCEGLATLLADFRYREDIGEGPQVRHEAITRYLSYVREADGKNLLSFHSASHQQQEAETLRAVGYQRGAMLFHELREKLGPPLFYAGLRQLISEFAGQSASWIDIEKVYSRISGQNLQRFFMERLQRSTLPSLRLQDVRLPNAGETQELEIVLTQEGEPYDLQVALDVTTSRDTSRHLVLLDQATATIKLPFAGLPLAVTLDPEYGMLRQLSDTEYPAIWSRFLGAEDKLVVHHAGQVSDVYAPLLAAIGEHRLVAAEQVNQKMLREASLLFLGSDLPAARELFGAPVPLESGARLTVQPNPLNAEKVAVLVDSATAGQLAAVASKLKHYGRYSQLHFVDGRPILKTISPTAGGIRQELQQLPEGGDTQTLDDFTSITKKLAENRIIYLGERHTEMADHQLQLQLLTALHQLRPKLAIGMEMFPASSQPAIDRYLAGTTDERTFLKESKYFDVWRFDYRYYREILRFARQNTIPVLALNLDREIVAAVYREGSTDALSSEQRSGLVPDRNLLLPGYLNRLREIHQFHAGGDDPGRLAGFAQAQALWDETMAQNITNYLQPRPEVTMLVLAGAEHTRKDSGIPPRVGQRLKASQATVITTQDLTVAGLGRVADYFFLTSALELPDAPKIGIVLGTAADMRGLRIDECVPQSTGCGAGLQVGDLLQTIDGWPIGDFDDVRIAMLDARPGGTVNVSVVRGEKSLEVAVPLTLPPAHPANMLP